MQSYLVGGSVRDQLLGLPIVDRDWVVVGATIEQLLAQGYQQVGKDFPVLLHPVTHEEYALARTERKLAKGHQGFVCYATPQVTLEQDLQRRDLTINAMAQASDGTLIDPYYGQRDLEQRCLRHVSPAFVEDPLRVLRVARFAACYAHLGFQIAPETLALMKSMADSGELLHLAAERVWKETAKALCSLTPQRYFMVLHACHALPLLFPELAQQWGSLMHTPWGEIWDSGDYLLHALAQSVACSEDLAVRFAVLCRSLAPIAPKQAGSMIVNKSEARQPEGLFQLHSFCNRLRVANQFRHLSRVVVIVYPMVIRALQLTPEEQLHLFSTIDIWRCPQRLSLVLAACQAGSALTLEIMHNFPPVSYLQQQAKKVLKISFSDMLQATEDGVARQAIVRSYRLQALNA